MRKVFITSDIPQVTLVYNNTGFNSNFRKFGFGANLVDMGVSCVNHEYAKMIAPQALT